MSSISSTVFRLESNLCQSHRRFALISIWLTMQMVIKSALRDVGRSPSLSLSLITFHSTATIINAHFAICE